MTWNPYGTGGDDPSTAPGEGLSGSQVPPSSWSAQQGSGYGGHGQSGYGQSSYDQSSPGQSSYDQSSPGQSSPGQSSPGQSSYDPAGASQSDSIPPAAAGAHYVPGSPARTSTGTNSVQKPGLRALAVFLVLGSLVYLGWHAGVWGEPLLNSLMLQNCAVPDGRLTCLTSDAIHRWVYAPMLGVLVAWGFASGAATEAKNGRARGYVHLLCGIAALVVGGLVSSQ